ncbi:hypothetical protein AB0C12_04985 [Actinoplanes sp. NPDC048967]|uniref:hypothetical protein n=1 Tax=Actinoplanes sp. NPDC048967 TaxID=3155269 RepID=UPI0033E3675C
MAFVVVAAALIVYFARTGIERADKLASCIAAVLALAALLAPYLLPSPPKGESTTVTEADEARETGTATASDGGEANSGVQAAGDDRPARAIDTGDAKAEGPGSVANTGVRRTPTDRS